MEALSGFLHGLDIKVVIILAAFCLMWIVAKALRWFFKLGLVVILIFVVFWKVPAAQNLLSGLIH